MALEDAHPAEGGHTHRTAKRAYVLMLLAKQKAKQEKKGKDNGTIQPK
jgi:hypothetical protein